METENEKILFRCDCHTKHAQILQDLKSDGSINISTHDDIWKEVRNKVSTKIFLTFVVLVVGGFGGLFGFLMTMNSDLKTQNSQIMSDLAVVKTKLQYNFFDHNKLFKQPKR